MKVLSLGSVLCFASALFIGISANGATADTSSYYEVPSFELNDLLLGRRFDEFSSAMVSSGIISVPLTHEHRHAALEGLCSCRDQMLSIEGTDQATLNDPQTLRTTLATATAGTTPLPLPDDLTQVCGRDTAEAMEGIRDDVATVTDAFVVALDRLLGNGSNQLMRNAYNGVYTTVSSIQASAKNLEHFHVYEKQKEKEGKDQDSDVDTMSNKDKSLFWHTDAGLFLAFVPALDCNHPGEADNSFWVDGKPVQFAPDSVTLMLGAGAEHWLNTQAALKATRHAVRMESGQVRSWYGMMVLAPDHAIVQENPPRTLADMRSAMSSLSSNKEEEAVSIGCGAVPESVYTNSRRSERRRRLQHVQDPSQCNNNTNFFCWMSCLDVPSHESIDEYLRDGYSLYCLDPAILASTGNDVSQAVEPCGYGNHNSNCLGKWTKTSIDVPRYDFGDRNSNDTIDERFCYGGTSMYMDGFHWTDTTCVIYLFPEWILSSKGKLALASFMTVIMSAVLEYVIFQRRQTMGMVTAGYKRLTLSALFYGTQLTLGYFLMLVIMTYSGPLFMCVVLGLVAGHVLFNSKDALLTRWIKPTANSTQPNKTEHGVPSDESRYGALSSANGNLNVVDIDETREMCACDEAEVAEGATPCCQNDL